MDEERSVGQRGPDKQPRDFNPKSLSNLKQNQKPIPTTNPSVSSGVNWSKIVIILASTIIAAFAIWKILKRKKRSDSEEQN